MVVAESQTEAMGRFERWKIGIESKGPRMNMDQTKVMISRGGGCVERLWEITNFCVLCVTSGFTKDVVGPHDVTGLECAVCMGSTGREFQIRRRPNRVDFEDMSLECTEFSYLV